MNTRAVILSGKREAAFTMVEIAISLGIIAFALVAIIGILPSGLAVQKDNREETIINQDARLIVEALKSRGRDGLGSLGSFVVSVDGRNVQSPNGLSTSNFVQLLSDPSMNHTCILSAISGGLATRESDVAFRYQLISSVVDPADPRTFASSETNLFGGVDQFVDRGNAKTLNLTNQIHDVRLRFVWPVIPDPRNSDPSLPDNFLIGREANKYVVRTMIAGWHTNGVMNEQEYFNPLP